MCLQEDGLLLDLLFRGEEWAMTMMTTTRANRYKKCARGRVLREKNGWTQDSTINQVQERR